MAAKATPPVERKPYVSAMQYRVKIINPNTSVMDMFAKTGHIVVHKDDEPFDILVFTGGEDITPLMYGQRFHHSTRVNVYRDMMEMDLLRSIKHDIPKVGICRGAQLLNVYNGGSMYQNVDNHSGSHDAFDILTGSTVRVTSTHHQMMVPTTDANWLLIAGEATEHETANEKFKVKPADMMDVEAVFYEHTNSLCYQPHPEHADGDCRDLFFGYIDAFLKEAVEKNRNFIAHAEKVKEQMKDKGTLNAC